jgi:hypothetical protein
MMRRLDVPRRDAYIPGPFFFSRPHAVHRSHMLVVMRHDATPTEIQGVVDRIVEMGYGAAPIPESSAPRSA